MSEPNPATPEEPHEGADPGDEAGGSSAPPDPSIREATGAEERVVQDVSFPELEDEEITGEPSKINRLLDVRLTLAVELGRREMLLQEVLNLGQGSILDLEKSSSELVDILINGKLLARGEVVVIDESFGVRITSLVDPVDRVKKMGV